MHEKRKSPTTMDTRRRSSTASNASKSETTNPGGKGSPTSNHTTTSSSSSVTPVINKKTELDRLLMDEGTINMLYTQDNNEDKKLLRKPFRRGSTGTNNSTKKAKMERLSLMRLHVYHRVQAEAQNKRSASSSTQHQNKSSSVNGLSGKSLRVRKPIENQQKKIGGNTNLATGASRIKMAVKKRPNKFRTTGNVNSGIIRKQFVAISKKINSTRGVSKASDKNNNNNNNNSRCTNKKKVAIQQNGASSNHGSRNGTVVSSSNNHQGRKKCDLNNGVEFLRKDDISTKESMMMMLMMMENGFCDSGEIYQTVGNVLHRKTSDGVGFVTFDYQMKSPVGKEGEGDSTLGSDSFPSFDIKVGNGNRHVEIIVWKIKLFQEIKMYGICNVVDARRSRQNFGRF